MARAELVVAGILIMVLLGWIPFIGWFVFLPTGFVIFIYGLVARSALETAALMRPSVIIAQPASLPAQGPQAGGTYCRNCGVLNPPDARFCSSCGTALYVTGATGASR